MPQSLLWSLTAICAGRSLPSAGLLKLTLDMIIWWKYFGLSTNDLHLCMLIWADMIIRDFDTRQYVKGFEWMVLNRLFDMSYMHATSLNRLATTYKACIWRHFILTHMESRRLYWMCFTNYYPTEIIMALLCYIAPQIRSGPSLVHIKTCWLMEPNQCWILIKYVL